MVTPLTGAATGDGIEVEDVAADESTPDVQDGEVRDHERLVVERVGEAGGEAADEVRLIVGVEPPESDQAGPSSPPTPITVELDERLDDRLLVDAARLPPIELEEAPAELSPDR